VSDIDWGRRRDRCPSCGRDGEHRMRGTLGIGPVGNPAHPLYGTGRLVAHCFRCGHAEAQEGGVLRPGGPVGVPAQAHRHETLSESARAFWRGLEPIMGDAAAYLRARSCVIPPADGDLRYHPALPHKPSGTRWPALIARVTDAVTREPLTLHRTWIQVDGRKAPVQPPRMLLGGHRKAGGVVRLWPDEAVTTGLGIAEGIETALALAHAYRPVWACIDAGNLAQLPVLPGIECLTIAADHDPAGIAAAETCGQRWADAGCDVVVAMATTPKHDLADVAALEAAA
jgi:putative DNA primase/helicase